MHNKLENPSRLAKLDPRNTLVKIGLKEGDVFCDIGAGTGVFTIPAAEITQNTTYALDVSEKMLEALMDKAQAHHIEHIQPINTEGHSYPIEDSACDIVFASCVYHEIPDKLTLFKEIRRILKPEGKLVIIEFFKKSSPFGPPITERVSIEELKLSANRNGFEFVKKFDLGHTYYLAEFVHQS